MQYIIFHNMQNEVTLELLYSTYEFRSVIADIENVKRYFCDYFCCQST